MGVVGGCRPPPSSFARKGVVGVVVTVCLLAGFLVGGGVWWRWAWERWRRALVAEQAGRARERFVAEVELGRWRSHVAVADQALREQRARLLAQRVEADLALWESELGDGS